MTISNLTPRLHKVWVCKPGEDETTGLEVTDALGGDGWFEAVDYPLDNGGRIRTTGRLVLRQPYNWSGESFNPWVNDTRWTIGNTILIQVRDASGTYQWHPRSGLRIASDPAPPTRSNPELELELADSLELFNITSEPDEDESEVTLGTNRSRDAIIQSLLTPKGLTLSSTIPLYPINYPIPKDGGSFVELAGAIAIGGLRALWVDYAGSVRARSLLARPRIRLFKQTIGTDDIGDFEPRQGAQRPASTLRATSVGQRVESADQSGTATYEEFGPREVVIDGGGSAIIMIGRREESWGWTSNVFARTRTIERCRNLVLNNDFYDAIGGTAPDEYAFVQDSYEFEKKIYEGSAEGRLQQESRYIREPVGRVFYDMYTNYQESSSTVVNDGGDGDIVSSTTFTPSGTNFLEPTTSRVERTTYYYNSDQTTRVVFEAKEPKGKIAGKATGWTSPFAGKDSQEIAETSEQTWAKYTAEEWERTETTQRAGQVDSGSIAAFLALGLTVETTRATDGSTQPPSADRRPPLYNREEYPLEASATFRRTDGDEFTPREDTIQFDHATQRGLEFLAEYFGLLQRGDHQGFRIISAWDDDYFNYQPISRVDVEFDGSVYIGITRTVTWAIADDESTVIWDCAKIGRVTGADNYTEVDEQDADTDYDDPITDPEEDSTQPWNPIHQIRPRLEAVLAIAPSIRPGGIATAPTSSTLSNVLVLAPTMRQYFGNAVLVIGGSITDTTPAYSGTMAGALTGSNTGYNVRVYFVPTTQPSAGADIDGYLEDEFIYGTDYSNVLPLTLSPIIQQNGPGYYILAFWNNGGSNQFWWSSHSLTLTDAATFTNDYWYDSGLGEVSGTPRAKYRIVVTDSFGLTVNLTPTGSLQTGNNLYVYYSATEIAINGNLNGTLIDTLTYGTEYNDVDPIDFAPYISANGEGYYYVGFDDIDITFDYTFDYTRAASSSTESYYDSATGQVSGEETPCQVISITNGDIHLEFTFEIVVS